MKPTVTGDATNGAVYSNKVLDYVANLDGFLGGYTAERPTTVAKSDIDVVDLPGTADGELFDYDDGQGDTASSFATRGNWVFECPSQPGTFVPLAADQSVLDVCGVASCEACGCESAGVCDQTCYSACTLPARPTRAKLVFGLDPYGRVNGHLAGDVLELRHNARWGLMAVNFVGTGIKDCSLSADPLKCYGEGFIEYDLRHTDDPWVSDYLGQWRTLALEPTTIESGKGLAAELWLDPLEDGWGTPYIGAVSRAEFRNRPVGGGYELTLRLGPEVRLERLERVQILIGSTYWVQQQ